MLMPNFKSDAKNESRELIEEEKKGRRRKELEVREQKEESDSNRCQLTDFSVSSPPDHVETNTTSEAATNE
jgi:hypothetical protein